MRRIRAVTFVFLMILAVWWFFLPGASHPETRGPRSTDEARWEDSIYAVGAARAYDELATSVSDKPFEVQHDAAHAFGAALFSLGEKLETCDDRFAYGCFHEYIGKTLAADGFSSIPALMNSCTESVGAKAVRCGHSIGHGILAHMGYSFDDLLKSLSLCSILPADKGRGACPGGIFMEYNVRTMLGNEPPRDPTDVYSPCNDVPSMYRHSCIYYLPLWWNTAFESEDEERRFSHMISLCKNLTGEDQRLCFAGVGRETIYVPEPPESSIRLCKKLSDEKNGELYCLTGAAYFLASFRDDQDAARAESVCAKLASNDQAYCLVYAHRERPITAPSLRE